MTDKGLFNGSRLRVGAVKNGDFLIFSAASNPSLYDFPRDPFSFFVLAPRFKKCDAIAIGIPRP